MKKIVLLLLFVFSCVFSFSQEKYSSYDSKLLNKKFDVLVSKDDNSKIKFWVSSYSLDGANKESMLIIEEENLNDFINYLDFLKSKFTEWKKTAIENKVDDLDKDISKLDKNYSSAFSYGKWQFDFSTELSSNFKIIKGVPSIRINSGELVSNSNQYIKSVGFVFIFGSEEEFDALKKVLDLQSAKDFFVKKESKQDLFKN